MYIGAREMYFGEVSDASSSYFSLDYLPLAPGLGVWREWCFAGPAGLGVPSLGNFLSSRHFAVTVARVGLVNVSCTYLHSRRECSHPTLSLLCMGMQT